jgi:hypothetical protein
MKRKTFDTTPPLEFRQAFWRVTGKEATPGNILGMLGNDDGTLWAKIRRVQAEILKNKTKPDVRI